jgi:hypothetical protein
VAKQQLFAAGVPMRLVRIAKPGAIVADAVVEFENGYRLPVRVILLAPVGLDRESIRAAGAVFAPPAALSSTLALISITLWTLSQQRSR